LTYYENFVKKISQIVDGLEN